MRSKPSRSALAAISLLCVILLAACSSGSPTLQSVKIAPTSASIDAGVLESGDTQQFTAMGFYSDGSQKDVTATTSWASSNSAIASIDATGLATAATPPDTTTVTITGSLGGSASTATLTVYHAIQSIAVTPVTQSIPLGLTQQYVAKGTYNNLAGASHVEDVSSVATWTSSVPGTATISGTGLATSGFTGAVTGTTNITAAIGSVTSSPVAVLTVTAPITKGLQVSPATPSIAGGTSSNLTALELKTDGTTGPLTGTVTWATSACTPAGAVTLAPSGTNGNEIVAGAIVGSCTVTATEGTFTGTSTVTVVAGTAHFAYISNSGGAPDSGSPSIGGYKVDTTSATPFGTAATLTPKFNYTPIQTIVNPNGKYLYDITDTSQVHLFTVNSGTGVLTAADPGTIPVAGAGTFNYGVIDPTGRFMYVIDNGASTVDSFVLSQTDGTLGAVRQSTGLNGPEFVTVDRTGHFIYVVSDNDKIYAFTINQTDGTLTASATPSYALAAGSSPLAVTVDPSNKYLYTANVGTGTVSAFTIDANGILGNPSTLTLTGAVAVYGLVVDPASKFLYVLDAGDVTTDPVTPGGVYAYAIGTNGALSTTPVAGSPFAAGANPVGSIVIDPTGKLLALDNNTAPSGTISLFTIGSGGVLTPTTPATVATGDSPLYVTFYNAAP